MEIILSQFMNEKNIYLLYFGIVRNGFSQFMNEKIIYLLYFGIVWNGLGWMRGGLEWVDLNGVEWIGMDWK